MRPWPRCGRHYGGVTNIRKLLRLIGAGYRKRWLIVVGLAALVGLLESVGTLIIFGLMGLLTYSGAGLEIPIVGDVRDRFPGVSDESFLLWSAGLAVGFFLLRAVLFVTQAYLQNRVAQNAGTRLSTRLVQGYIEMPYIEFLSRHSAELTRNAVTSVTQIVNFGFIPIVILSSEVLLVAGIVIALFIASPPATALAVGVIAPLVFVLLRATQRRMRTLGTIHQEMSRDVLQLLQESLQNLRDIRILARERFFMDAFRTSRARLGRVIYLRGLLQEIPRVSTETMLVVSILVFLAITVRLGNEVDRTLALLGTFGYAGVRILPALNRVIVQLNNLRFSSAAVNDVHAELERLAAWEGEEPTGAGEEMSFEGAIEIRQLSFRFHNDGDLVLEELDLVIPRGTSVGFVGPTGAGKSTLVDVIMGLLKPTTGQVLVDGVSVHDLTRAWQRKLGVVPQSTLLLDDSLRHNIALGVPYQEIDSDAVVRAVRLAQLHDFIETLPEGLDTLVGERGVRLSGGQRQRVAIARALYRSPEVLIFDEATAALDNVTEARLMDAIDELRGDRTILMVAHRLSTVSRCDQIFVLDRGRLIDTGTFQELGERNALFRGLRA